MNARLRIFQKNGTQLAISSSGTGELSTSASCVANDTVYAWVELFSGCGSYELLFEVDSPPAHDQDVEPNNSIAQANNFIAPNETAEGRIGYNGFNISDISDYHGLIPDDDGTITISANIDSTMTARLRIFQKNGTQLAISSTGTGELSTSAFCVAKDTVYAWVEGFSFGCGSYELLFEHTAPTFSNDLEANNSIATAIPIATADTVEGHLRHSGFGFSDPSDFYEFTVVQAPFELDAKLTIADGLSTRLRLFSSSGSQLFITSTSTSTLNLTETLSSPGTYFIMVEGISGCGSYQLGDLCGEYPDDPTISAGGSLEFCDGDNVVLTSSAADSYLWSNGETTQSITVTEGGDYSVTIFDINGCPTASATSTTVTVNPIPTAEISADGPLEFCITQDFVQLTSSPGVSYLWSTGESTQSITISESGSHTVTVTDANGCVQTSAPIETIANPLPPMPTITASGPTEICEGASVTLTSSPAFAYEWTNGQTTQSITVGQNNSLHSVIAIDENGCMSASQETITISTMPNTFWYADADGDGQGDANNSVVDCEQPAGFVANDDDCDDSDENIFVGATCDDGDPLTINDILNINCDCVGDDNSGPEVCDGIDNDGDGLVDEGFDADSDGIADCFDTEECDGQDNDGDGQIDEGFDNDNDGIANCFDTEECDGIDNDGDGQVDEGLLITFYADTDGDGFGDPANTTMACEAPIGFVSNMDDCDDTNSSINPDAAEICNGIDDDCDGMIDEGFDSDMDGTADCFDIEECDGIDNDGDGMIDEGVLTTYFADNDGDGFGDINTTIEACSPPMGFVENSDDCDDTDDSLTLLCTVECDVDVTFNIGTFVVWENLPQSIATLVTITDLNNNPATGNAVFNILDSNGNIFVANVTELPFALAIGDEYILELIYSETGTPDCESIFTHEFKVLSIGCSN